MVFGFFKKKEKEQATSSRSSYTDHRAIVDRGLARLDDLKKISENIAVGSYSSGNYSKSIMSQLDDIQRESGKIYRELKPHTLGNDDEIIAELRDEIRTIRERYGN